MCIVKDTADPESFQCALKEIQQTLSHLYVVQMELTFEYFVYTYCAEQTTESFVCLYRADIFVRGSTYLCAGS